MVQLQKDRVTGSGLFRAIGLESPKEQKQFFDISVSKFEPTQPTEAKQNAMKYGTESYCHYFKRTRPSFLFRMYVI